MTKGRLTIAGCGLHPGHMTLETQSLIQTAEVVLLVAPNPLSIQHILQLNPNTEHLGRFYTMGYSRPEIYQQMAKRIIELVTDGKDVCTVFYGHPGVFVSSTRMASRVLKPLGHEIKMLPGISADACLYADLDLDPADTGCQSYESTRFLLTRRQVDTSAALILWQIGLTGEHSMDHFKPGEKGLDALTKLLLQSYPPDHQVCLYEAPIFPGFEPKRDWVALAELPKAEVNTVTTLYVPACKTPEFAEDRLSWLGLTEQDIHHWDEYEEVESES
ncbi:methylase [Bowmanella sp. Y26]|uniref:SAM-dependent methyltransferase n=1 Tax=Bowmanella yangjiangensis TaxID=2811230 RepID=UPI001BDC6672|nr:SAM-dependent methyltransferase [Bowmanella yangjiangensis]MBT1064667.1 methylase [Bowmanella yangjiangensis]